MIFRGIPMSTWSVLRILAGAKTQTRRVFTVREGRRRVLPYEPYWSDVDGELHWMDKYGDTHNVSECRCRYGQVGDGLYFREGLYDGPTRLADYGAAHYLADGGDSGFPWGWKGSKLPSIFMPRRLARIAVEITGLRVEQLQAITWEDCVAEGLAEGLDGLHRVDGLGYGNPYLAYAALWKSLHPKPPRDWNSNPWVQVIEWRVLSMERRKTQRLLAA